jgi:hypothetical protein
MKNQLNNKQDNLNVKNLDVALRMTGIIFDNKTIEKIINIVHLIQENGDQTTIKDVCSLTEELK